MVVFFVKLNMFWCSLFLPCVQLAFQWFDKGILDLEPDTQALLFNHKVLKVNPMKLHDAGGWGWRLYSV